jgi:copper chaperone CopZ
MTLFVITSLFSINADAQTADSVKTTVVKVGNLTCNGDMPTIKKQLLNQEGIDEVTFTPRADGVSTFTINYHSSITNRKKIEKVIETTPGCDDKTSTPYRVKKEKDKE